MKYISLIITTFPLFASAKSFKEFVETTVTDILNFGIWAMFSLCVIVFLSGLVTFIRDVGDDPKAWQSGRQRMIYGIIGLSAAIGVWGLVQITKSTLGI